MGENVTWTTPPLPKGCQYTIWGDSWVGRGLIRHDRIFSDDDIGSSGHWTTGYFKKFTLLPDDPDAALTYRVEYDLHKGALDCGKVGLTLYYMDVYQSKDVSSNESSELDFGVGEQIVIDDVPPELYGVYQRLVMGSRNGQLCSGSDTNEMNEAYIK
ncbi:hypothetical protein AT251_19080 [Enterovibrio nigricans]|uniref:Uncharacterized protein n=2 Tax=Enterovibrio nigricans TaxID=504469 RepID=A0A1T4VU65_9GAMM|nr:hypothetical protein AT251_19080 [Enterovibrio nigricans]SKA68554.1 hypothetical protein SAMN02745132_04306 [Enterovibrio nigricans DSM 22720]